MADNSTANVTEAAATPALTWPACNPDLVLEALRSLNADRCPENKKFFPSYGTKWSSLSDLQKNKSQDFFQQLPSAVQQSVINYVECLEKKEAELDSSRSENTNKHDRVRLIHLWMAPSAQTHWTAALSPLPRAVLDDKDNRKALYDILADMFNNYEDYVFQNNTIQYVDGAATVPYVAL